MSATANRLAPWLAACVAVLCLVAPQPRGAMAGTDALVPPDPWQVIHVAREFGPAEVDRDGMGDPQIRATTDGLHYRVTFYGCTLGRDCDTILFDARFSRKDWNEEASPDDLVAGWNGEKLFGRAWLDDQHRAVLDHPVTLGGGMPASVLKLVFETWARALGEYADHLGVR